MMIKYKHLDEFLKYDGSQIDPFWAFKFLKIKGSSIITWIGPMNIASDNIKDFEDIDLEIKSANMTHFILEFFDIQPPNIEIAYMRQRLLVMIFKEELHKQNIISTRSGDDIFVSGRKLTVSIASISPTSMKIHFGFNLEDNGTPEDVETIGLFDIENSNGKKVFNNENIVDFISTVVNSYIDELSSIKEDIGKTNFL
ncbi:DUF366 family protein [Methanobrevibacter sp. DSM 116169]|uniref:DUF366 family protein n=1 Tax=Methanobrevibacter sp. DSM 116169 TaxID=3242727 RepID=UPI0038FCCE82